jgi:phosphate transport system substrate-binding protein
MNSSVLYVAAAAGAALLAAAFQPQGKVPGQSLPPSPTEKPATSEKGQADKGQTDKGQTDKGATVQVDPRIPDYQPVQGVSGTIKSVGSDTMNNLMTLWLEGFKALYPNVTTEMEGKGSGTAPTALIAGTASVGPMSRPMKKEEIANFEKAFGYAPLAVPTSIDMLAVYVHRDNPIAELSLQQIDAIFSKTRLGGLTKEIRTWGELGLTGEWADKPIVLHGRNSASGTYGYFKEHALFKGDYKDTVKEQVGSSSVVGAVAADRYAIGYSGIGAKTADVRAVPLKADANSAAIAAEPKNAYTGEYPLARILYAYVNYKPGSELDPLRREFLRYVLSKRGQADVVKDGFFPLPATMVQKALGSFGVPVNLVEAGAGR